LEFKSIEVGDLSDILFWIKFTSLEYPPVFNAGSRQFVPKFTIAGRTLILDEGLISAIVVSDFNHIRFRMAAGALVVDDPVFSGFLDVTSRHDSNIS
jgi:hypothetical protein